MRVILLTISSFFLVACGTDNSKSSGGPTPPPAVPADEPKEELSASEQAMLDKPELYGEEAIANVKAQLPLIPFGTQHGLIAHAPLIAMSEFGVITADDPENASSYHIDFSLKEPLVADPKVFYSYSVTFRNSYLVACYDKRTPAAADGTRDNLCKPTAAYLRDLAETLAKLTCDVKIQDAETLALLAMLARPNVRWNDLRGQETTYDAKLATADGKAFNWKLVFYAEKVGVIEFSTDLDLETVPSACAR